MKKTVIIRAALICAVFTGWLRMAGTRLIWPNFGYLIGKPLKEWAFGFWAAAALEIIYFSWLYILPIILFFIIIKYLKQKNSFTINIAVGSLCGLIGYIIVAMATRIIWTWETKEVLSLAIIYSITGGLFAIQHYISLKKITHISNK